MIDIDRARLQAAQDIAQDLIYAAMPLTPQWAWVSATLSKGRQVGIALTGGKVDTAVWAGVLSA